MQVKDVITFIKTYDRNGPFSSWNKDTLAVYLKSCIDQQAFLWNSDDIGIAGIAFGRWRPNKVMHVEYMLTRDKGMPTFLKTFHLRYPDVTLIAFRHGKLRNLTKLLQRYAKGSRTTNRKPVCC